MATFPAFFTTSKRDYQKNLEGSDPRGEPSKNEMIAKFDNHNEYYHNTECGISIFYTHPSSSIYSEILRMVAHVMKNVVRVF